MSKTHNAHMLIKKEIWAKAKKLAKSENKTMTELVCEGLSLLIATRNKEKDQHEISDAQSTHTPN
jgi:hypothetical protein